MALWSTAFLRAFLTTRSGFLPDVQVDFTVLVATFLLSLVAGLASGLAPALHASRGELQDAL